MFCSYDSGDQELSTCSVCMQCYHMQCIKPTLGRSSHASADICHHWHIIESGKISQLKIDAKRPGVDMLMRLLSDADTLGVEVGEKVLISQIVEKALAYKDCLIKIVEFSLTSLGNDPSVVFRQLSTALKAVEMAGVYDRESSCKFEFALARNSWRVRASNLLQASQKPLIHQIRRLLKEGQAINVPLEGYFWTSLTEIKDIGLQWALELYKVFELIDEGENLPVHFDNELKLLRERSMIYCICRKLYDWIPMICCEEWYHFKCIKLSWVPKDYICPA